MAADSSRVAIVTGASRGIGLAIAAELLRHDGRVFLTGRDAATLDAAVNELDPDGSGVVVGCARGASCRRP